MIIFITKKNGKLDTIISTIAMDAKFKCIPYKDKNGNEFYPIYLVPKHNPDSKKVCCIYNGNKYTNYKDAKAVADYFNRIDKERPFRLLEFNEKTNEIGLADDYNHDVLINGLASMFNISMIHVHHKAKIYKTSTNDLTNHIYRMKVEDNRVILNFAKLGEKDNNTAFMRRTKEQAYNTVEGIANAIRDCRDISNMPKLTLVVIE